MKQSLLSSWCNVSTTLAMTVGSPSAHRRGTLLKLISILVLILTIGVGQMWGETITLNKSALTSLSNNNYDSGATKTDDVGNVTFEYKDLCYNGNNIQAKASSGVIYNKTLVPGKITNVAITHSGTARATTIYMGTSSSEISTSVANGSGSISGNAPANTCPGYFKITRGSNAAQWSQVVVTYTPATITLSKNSITNLDYNVGSGPSSEQSFTVSGSNIPANLTVTAPTNFQVKVGNGSWGNSGTITVTLSGSANAGTLSSTTVYVRLASGKSAGNYNGNVEISMNGCKTITNTNPKTVAVSGTVSASAGPTLTTSSSMSTLTYSNGSPVAQSFTIGGSNLTSTVTVSAPTNYEVCKTADGEYASSVSFTNTEVNAANKTVYIRLQSELSAGNIASSDITVASSGADSKTIAVTGSVPYTITWMANGSLHTTTYVAVGGTLTLPATDPVPGSCGCTNKAFYGWYGGGTSYEHATTAPSIAAAGNAVTADKTYYAVFATASSGGSASYNLVESAPASWAGNYLIVYNNTYALNTHYGNQNANTYSTYTDISSSYSNKKITSNATTDALAHTVAATTNGYSIYSNADESYLGCTTATNAGLRWDTEFAASSDEWTLGVGAITSVAQTGRGIRWNTNNGQERFATYTTSSMGAIQLFKYTSSTTYSNYATTCCQPLGSINGSVSLSQKSATLSWDLTGAQNGGKDHINSWKVEYKLSSDDEWSVAENALAKATLTKTISGLNCNTDYDFRVSANVQSGYCDIVKEWTSQKTTKFTITKDETGGGGITLSPTATSVCDGDVIDVTASTPDGSHEGNGVIKVIKTGADPEEDVTSTVYNQPSAGKLTMPAYDITITATYAEKQSPSVGVSVDALNFNDPSSPKKGDVVAAKTFNLTGSALVAGTLTLVAPDGYTVSPSSIDVAAGALAATEITVTPSTVNAGTFNGSISISGAGVSSTNIVALTMTVQETYTVNWYVNGTKVHDQTDVANMAYDAIPDDFSAFTDCVPGFHFIGWTESAIVGGSSTSAPSMATIGTKITADKDYYAVFADGTPGSTIKLLEETFDNERTSDNTTAITEVSDNFTGSGKVYEGAYGTLKFGSSSERGHITSKTLDLSEAFTVKVSAKQYSSDASVIYVQVGEDKREVSTTDSLTNEFKTFTFVFEGTEETTITIGESGKRGYIDDVVVSQTSAPVWTKYYTTCPHYYSVNLTNSGVVAGKGSFVADKASALAGESVTLNATGTTGAGRFKSWSITGLDSYSATTNPLTFEMPARSITVSATFDALYEITKDEQGGAITCVQYAAAGDNVSVSAVAKAQYKEPATLTVFETGNESNEITVSAGVFTMPTYGVTVRAVCDPAIEPLDPPTLSAATGATYQGVTLNWTGVTGNEGYVLTVQQGGVNVEGFVNVAIDKGATSYTIASGLAANTDYTYSIYTKGDGVNTLVENTPANGSFSTEDYPFVHVTYSENGVTNNANTSAEPVGGRQLENAFALPSSVSNECTKVFVGWTDASPYTHGTSDFYAPSANYTIHTNADVTLYAVYATETPGTATWDEITAVPTAGTYAIYAEGYFLKAEISSSRFSNGNDGTNIVTDSKLTVAPDADCQWELSINASEKFLLKNGTKYAGGTTSKNQGALLTDATNTHAQWEITYETDKFVVKNVGRAADSSDPANAYLRQNGSYGWACYSSTHGDAPRFFKKNPGAPSYTDHAITCTGKVATPSFSGVTDGETYEENQTVGLNCGTTGATIRYTMSSNGEAPADPTDESTSATSITLENNGTYIIKAKAFKTNMDASDVATITVTIDKPISLAQFLETKPSTTTKVDLTDAVIWGQKSDLIFVQQGTAAIALYKYNHGKSEWIYGKKISGIVTASKYNLYHAMPEMNVSDFGEANVSAAEDADYPDALVVTDDNADASMDVDNAFRLIQMSNMVFGEDDNSNVTITSQGSETFYFEDELSILTDKTLPLPETKCTVLGILYPWYEDGENYGYNQLAPFALSNISTNGALAPLPSLTGEVGGADSEHATLVPNGEKITLTAATGTTATYQIGEETQQSITTNGTDVTISGNNESEVVVTVSSARDFYTNNSKDYYYKIDNSLIRYNIDKATATNGSFVVKNSDGNEITSSVSGATITLAATPQSNEDGRYHFGSWTIRNANNDDVTASVSISSATNKDATFTMPAYAVTVSATFVEDDYATVSFAGGTGATGTAPASQKVYVGYNATMPACTFKKDDCSFLAWELNSTSYNVGDTYEVTSTDAVEFTATWQEKIIAKDGQWELVTDANELSVGDFIVIAQNAQGKTESATVGGSSNKYLSGVATTFSGDNNEYITKTNLNENTVKYVLGGTSGAWILTDDATGKELSINNSDNPSWVDEDGSTWNIAITDGNTCIYLGNSTTKRVMFNTSGGFRPYTTGPTNQMLYPQIYKFYRTAYKVTYDANGGEGAPKVQRANPETNQVTISATEPTRENYTFTGWEDSENNSYSGTVTLTGDVTLYAQWSANPFNMAVASVDNVTISATPAEASAVAEGENTNIAHGTEVTLAYSDVNNAYLFVEWNVTKADDAETVVTVTNNKFAMPTYAVTVSANVQAKTSVILNVTYEADGGEGTMEGNPFEYTYEQEVTVAANAFTKVHYTFTGWQDQDENVYKPGDKFSIVKNMTLTALWRANGAMYTVTSNTAVSSSASVPAGSTATYSQTYSGNNGQMTQNQSTTLTLTGYAGKIIKKAIFSMKTNKNSGAGTIEMTIGDNTVINYPSDEFGTWFGSNTDSYKDIEVTLPNVLVNANEKIVVTMTASANSMYVKSYTFEYANAEVYDGTAEIPAGEKEVIVVKDGGNVTLTGNVNAEDVIVEAGGKVTLSSNKLTVVGTFTIETTMASGKSGQLTGATVANFAANGPAYIDITLGANGDPNKWHAFTVPFPVDVLNGIYDLDGNKLTNEVNYAIMDYHGDIRAKGNYGWKKFRGVMVPGTFYLMTVDGERTTYRMKKTDNGALVAENSKAYYEYASSTGNNDNGWNGIGNPNLFYGKVNLAVQVLDPGSNTYVTKTAGSTNFVVGTPFFYQATADGSMVMATANADANYAPKRVQTTEIKDMPVSFGNEDFTDYLYVSASEDALNQYETGKDLVKMTMTNTPSVAQIFGMAYNTKLCMVNTPLVNNKAEVALELYAPADGEYTISTEVREDATVYLLYEGRIIWNLSAGAYTSDFVKGNNTGYGIRVVKAPKVTTGIENEPTSDSLKGRVSKVVIDNNVFILRDGQMFDVTGKMAK